MDWHLVSVSCLEYSILFWQVVGGRENRRRAPLNFIFNVVIITTTCMVKVLSMLIEIFLLLSNNFQNWLKSILNRQLIFETSILKKIWQLNLHNQNIWKLNQNFFVESSNSSPIACSERSTLFTREILKYSN